MELALCLAPGLDVNGVSILYKAAKPSLQVSTALLLLLLSTTAWALVQLLLRVLVWLMIVNSPSLTMGCRRTHSRRMQLMQGYSLEPVSGHPLPCLSCSDCCSEQ